MTARFWIWSTQNNLGAFRCPGCERDHVVSPSIHEWNGNAEKPTISPSVLVTYNGPDAGQEREDMGRAPYAVCHSFVREGRIEFLSDCTHPLAGQTVDLPPCPHEQFQ